MNRSLLLSGLIGAVIFITTTLTLGALLPEYSSISRTVSEIGRVGSPFQIFYTAMDVVVGCSIIIYAWSLQIYSSKKIVKSVLAFCLFIYGCGTIGLGIYPTPHPYHNIAGMSLILAYFAPLFAAIAATETSQRWISLSAFIWVLFFMALNLSPMFAPELYPLELYGLMQRALLYGYLIWLALHSIQHFRLAADPSTTNFSNRDH
jgi:hypothetical membrane protein